MCLLHLRGPLEKGTVCGRQSQLLHLAPAPDPSLTWQPSPHCLSMGAAAVSCREGLRHSGFGGVQSVSIGTWHHCPRSAKPGTWLSEAARGRGACSGDFRPCQFVPEPTSLGFERRVWQVTSVQSLWQGFLEHRLCAGPGQACRKVAVALGCMAKVRDRASGRVGHLLTCHYEQVTYHLWVSFLPCKVRKVLSQGFEGWSSYGVLQGPASRMLSPAQTPDQAG